MFIEPGWQSSVIALLTAINAMAGAPNRTTPLRPLDIGAVVAIGEALRTGTYQPADWFGAQGPGALTPAVATLAPPIGPTANYAVIVASSSLSGMEMISKRSGGILYEDPFYALLASFNLGRFGMPWAEQIVINREIAWQRRPQILAELARGEYRPERYFHLAGRLMAHPGAPYLSAHSAAGRELLHLQDNGRADASLDGGPGLLYLFYKYQVLPAPSTPP